MGTIDMMMEFLKKGKEMSSNIEELQKFNPKSLTKSVDDSTFMFSCLTSDQVPIDRATTIVRNMERVYAGIVQQFFSQNQMIDITVDKTPLSYIRKFHQNYKSESAIDMVALENTKKKRKEYLSFMESNFPELEVSEEDIQPLMEEAYDGGYRLFIDPFGSYGIAFKESVFTSKEMEDYKNMIQEHLNEFDLRPFPLTEAPDGPSPDELMRSELRTNMIQGLTNRSSLQQRDVDVKQWKEMKAPQLLDREVKKANDMMPYAIQVRLMAVNDKKEFVQYIDFIVGVKAYLHSLSSRELVANISYVLQNKNFMFNMIRWVTGEISLFKHIIFNIDEIKFDVTNQASGMSSWIPTLKRLRNKRVAANLYGVHKLVPNNTFIITTYEVDEVRKLTGMDLRDVAVAKRVMEKLFTIAFIIVDDGTETVDILYDSRGDYQTYSLETLEREVAMNSNKLGKEIGRMISR